MNKFYIYPGNYSYTIKEGLLRRGNWQEDTDNPNPFLDCNFIWKPTNLSITEYNKLDATVKARPKNLVQVFNHFENIRGICTKTGLVRSLKKYYQTNAESRNANYKVFDSTPTSFLITAGVEDHEYASFVARYKQIAKQNFTKESIPQKHCEGNYWLVKPANLNQGRGIEVFKSLKDINVFLSSRPRDSFWVVQKYVEKPLLYHKRKFDIRVWVVITAKNEVFLYKKAYIRTSSDDYDLKATKNYVHLTNNCLQQHGENYGKHEDGNTLPLTLLDEVFKEVYPDLDAKLADHIVPRMRDLIIDTFLCSQNLNPSRRKNVFEFFGFDFLIDEDLRTWLIEVNTNPYLGIPNDFIAQLLPRMIDDMLEIAVDPLFPPKNRPRGDSRPNDYELIYCEQGSSYHNGQLNLRSPFTKNVYPISSLIPPDFQKKLKKRDSIQNYYECVTTQPDDNNEMRIQDEGARSPEKKGNIKTYDRNDIESIYKQLYLSVAYKSEINSNVVSNQIGRVLSYIRNWELLSRRDVKTACKALILIAESVGSSLLAEQSIILTMSKLLRSHEVKADIKFTLIETINILSKDIYLRKKLICNHLIQNLITLCLSSCEEKDAQDHRKGFLMATLKCLVNLGCVFNRKVFIPGETREATKLRSFFIAQGGIIALWIISQKSLDAEMREYCSKNFLNHLEFSDWEKQLQVLDLAMHMPNTISGHGGGLDSKRKEGAGGDSAHETQREGNNEVEGETKRSKGGDMEAIFYKTAEFQVIEKALNLKGDQNSKHLEKVIYFTGEMLKVLPLDKLRQEFADHIKGLKDEWEKREKREAEEREKRLLIESEKMKKEELKRKDLDEQRRMALETFEKRVQNTLKKQQIENERRQKELEEMRQREIQTRKKNIEALLNKKADRERKKIKYHSPKPQLRKSKDGRLDESQDKDEMKYSQLKAAYNLNNERNKSLGNLTVNNSNSSPVLHHSHFANEIYGSVKGGRYLDRVENETDNKKPKILTQKHEKSDSNRSSPSQMQRDHHQYLLSPTNLAEGPNRGEAVHYSTSAGLKRESPEDFYGSNSGRKEHEKRKSPNNQGKLPKLQKAGRLMMIERIAQSPYIKTAKKQANLNDIRI